MSLDLCSPAQLALDSLVDRSTIRLARKENSSRRNSIHQITHDHGELYG